MPDLIPVREPIAEDQILATADQILPEVQLTDLVDPVQLHEVEG